MKTAEEWVASYYGDESMTPLKDIILAAQRDSRAELEAKLLTATSLLTRVVTHELCHHQSGRVWCKLMTDPHEQCTCGQWELTADIEKFIEATP